MKFKRIALIAISFLISMGVVCACEPSDAASTLDAASAEGDAGDEPWDSSIRDVASDAQSGLFDAAIPDGVDASTDVLDASTTDSAQTPVLDGAADGIPDGDTMDASEAGIYDPPDASEAGLDEFADASEAGFEEARDDPVNCEDFESVPSGISLEPGASLVGIDLRCVDLHDADLTGADLSAADLRGADLTGANLTDADLTEADLRGADLTEINLSGAELAGARTHDLLACPDELPGPSWTCVLQPANDRYALLGPYVDLRGANLAYVDLTTIDLIGADMTDADLFVAKVFGLVACPEELPTPLWRCVEQPDDAGFALIGRNADLREANLSGLDLAGADLRSANLGLADLSNANLAGANLGGADIDGTDLSYAVLDEANLRATSFFEDAKLVGASFVNADLSFANLYTADPKDAVFTGATLEYAATTGLKNCPDTLPADTWACRPESGSAFALLGPKVDLYSADFADVDLSGGLDLRGANLFYANLNGANLSDAQLQSTDIDRADFRNANLSGANMTDAIADFYDVKIFDLIACPAVLPTPIWRCVEQPANSRYAMLGPNVDFYGADLSYADLSYANLYSCDLRYANLSYADATGADLSAAQIANAIFTGVVWSNTICPNKTNSDEQGGVCP